MSLKGSYTWFQLHGWFCFLETCSLQHIWQNDRLKCNREGRKSSAETWGRGKVAQKICGRTKWTDLVPFNVAAEIENSVRLTRFISFWRPWDPPLRLVHCLPCSWTFSLISVQATCLVLFQWITCNVSYYPIFAAILPVPPEATSPVWEWVRYMSTPSVQMYWANCHLLPLK